MAHFIIGLNGTDCVLFYNIKMVTLVSGNIKEKTQKNKWNYYSCFLCYATRNTSLTPTLGLNELSRCFATFLWNNVDCQLHSKAYAFAWIGLCLGYKWSDIRQWLDSVHTYSDCRQQHICLYSVCPSRFSVLALKWVTARVFSKGLSGK